MKKFIREYCNCEDCGFQRLIEEIDEKENTIFEGDYLHDKINEKIDGFLLGITYADIGFSVESREIEGCGY